MAKFKVVAFAMLVFGLTWFQFAQPLTAGALAEKGRDLFDPRPPRRILLLGNSRTYFNDLPRLVRAVADSADDPQKFQITMHALGGASFKSHWENAATQKLLREEWDDVILQSESWAQVEPATDADFQRYGEQLIALAKANSRNVRLVINWGYGPELYGDRDPSGMQRASYRGKIESSTRWLGNRSKARVIDVQNAWQSYSSRHPEIALTSDGNHPTMAGSYLYALALYENLSQGGIERVTYLPPGIERAAADSIKRHFVSEPG